MYATIYQDITDRQKEWILSGNRPGEHNEKGETMATIVKKSDLTYEEGHLLHDGIIVAFRWESQYMDLGCLINNVRNTISIKELEADLQAARRCIDIEQPLLGLERPATPALDARCKQEDDIAAEVRALEVVNEAERFANNFSQLIAFIKAKKVIIRDEDYRVGYKLEDPVLGNPLKLTMEGITELLKEVAAG
jgi:hypothetical protein